MLQTDSTELAVSRVSYSANAKGAKATNNFKEFKCSFKQVTCSSEIYNSSNAWNYKVDRCPCPKTV